MGSGEIKRQPLNGSARGPATVSKRAQLQDLADAAHTLLLATEKVKRHGLPDWEAALDFEQGIGGREAALEWFGGVVRTMNIEQVLAMRWMLLDTQREMLGGFAEKARAWDLYQALDQAALAEKRRIQEIATARGEQLGVRAGVYVDLAEQVLREADPGLPGKVLNHLLSKKIRAKSLPERQDKSLYAYFKKAKQRMSGSESFQNIIS